MRNWRWKSIPSLAEIETEKQEIKSCFWLDRNFIKKESNVTGNVKQQQSYNHINLQYILLVETYFFVAMCEAYIPT